MAEYITVDQFGYDEFTEKRSRFIGYCKPVKTQDEAVSFINEIKAKHWDAKHNVYAYILSDGQTMRYSDDGEPQGTAGVPVLEVMKKSGVVDAVIVVTRYFGGILLGGGGLVRAYSQAASIALEAAQLVTMELCCECCVQCTYNQYGKVGAVIPSCGGVVDDTLFEENVSVLFHIPKEAFGKLNKALADATSGEVSAGIQEEKFYKKFERK
ncbi:MAG: YigZ family protein [Acutalibacteraceae bacterium]|nr:YigZ family protein [Clostridia bacterium]MEE3449089.1 YigZ family protein [Acutalibacteraceae bacterium]